MFDLFATFCLVHRQSSEMEMEFGLYLRSFSSSKGAKAYFIKRERKYVCLGINQEISSRNQAVTLNLLLYKQMLENKDFCLKIPNRHHIFILTACSSAHRRLQKEGHQGLPFTSSCRCSFKINDVVTYKTRPSDCTCEVRCH